MKSKILCGLLFTVSAFAGYGGPMVIIDGTTQVPANVTADHELKVIQTAPVTVNFPSLQNVVVTNFPSPSPTITVRVSNFPSPVPTQTVAGIISVSNFPSPVPTQSVSVVNFPTPVPTQSVAGTVSVNNFPSPVPTQSVAGTVSVDNFPAVVQVVFASPTPAVSVANQITNYATETGGHLASMDTKLSTINTTLGLPFQAGGSIGNSSFGISGTLPAYGSTPTFNLGTLNGAATAANQSTANASLSSINTQLGHLTDDTQTSQIVDGSGNSADVTAGGLLKVDASGAVISVSGTVTANAGSGTFAVSAASLPLPLNAATDASVTGLQVSQGSTTSGQKGALTLGAVTTAAPTYTTAQSSPLSLTTSGALRVDNTASTQPVVLASPLPTGSNTIGAVTQASGPWTQNITQFASSAVATGTGASGSGIPRVTVANDSNILATQSGTWTVQPGNTPNTTAWLVNQVGRAKANAPVRNDYTSVNITTAAYVQLVAATTSATSVMCVFDSSGQTLLIGVGAAASEVVQMNIFPGGNGCEPLSIPAGSRVAIKAVSGTASVGELDINFYQ